MRDVLDEESADKQVIAVLIREVRRLNKLVKGKDMSKFFRDENGKLFVAHQYEEITEHDLREELDKSKSQIEGIEKILGAAPSTPTPEAPANPATPEAPTAPLPHALTPFGQPPVVPPTDEQQPPVQPVVLQ